MSRHRVVPAQGSPAQEHELANVLRELMKIVTDRGDVCGIEMMTNRGGRPFYSLSVGDTTIMITEDQYLALQVERFHSQVNEEATSW